MVPMWVAAVPGLLCLTTHSAGASRCRSDVATAAAAWVPPPFYRRRSASSSNSNNGIETRRHRRHKEQQERPSWVTSFVLPADGSGGNGSVVGSSKGWVWCAGNCIEEGRSKPATGCASGSSSSITAAVIQPQPGRPSALRCSNSGAFSDGALEVSTAVATVLEDLGHDWSAKGQHSWSVVKAGWVGLNPETKNNVIQAVNKDGEGRLTGAAGAAGAAAVSDDCGEAFRGGSRVSVSQVQGTHARPEGPTAEAVTAFFCGSMGLTADQMNALVAKAPKVLEMSVSEQLAPQADRWLDTAGLGLTRKSLGRMVAQCPEVFLSHYDSVLAPIVVWLMVDVRVPRNRVGRLLEAFPLILAKDLETELRPRHRWLIDSLQLQTKDARRLLSLVPELLHVSMEETLTPACDWLMAAAGGCDMAGVGKMAERCPELLITEPSVMQECLEMIAQEVFEGDMARASVLFGRQPLLLSYSDRIGPLVRLMTDELKATVPQAVEVLANDPSIVEFQLERHVLPRLEAVRRAGVGEIVNGAPLPLSGKLKVLGKFSDARFAKWLRREGNPQDREEQASRSHRPAADDGLLAADASLQSW